ncbi:MAG: MazG nucleotide pyrophosphohydrolase domain-containing protein, partial [Spirochaetia bacterium]|jgi:ATP diphosphatase
MAWMKEQEGAFTVESALTHIANKLIRRHPHVFAGAPRGDAKQVLVQWEAIKAQEKAAALRSAAGEASLHPPEPRAHFHPEPRGHFHPEPRGHFTSALDGVPSSYPPLEKAAKLQKKAAKVGFDWPDPRPVWDKIDEELGELRAAVKAGARGEIEAELGDILFSVVNLSRLLQVEPTLALHRANVKFERRFREVERRLAAEGASSAEAGLDRMDALWNQVKAAESASGDGQSTSK